MKKRFPRLISAVLTLCLVLSAVAPLMLFASDGDTAKADSYVFRETFSSGSVNTSGAGSDIEKAGGFFAALGDSTYSLDNSTLKYFIASGEKNAYFDIRFNGDTTKKDLTQSFVFSFWVKPDSDSFSAQFQWKDTQDGNAYEANLFRIYNGYVYSNGTTTKYENAKLNANEWSLFEIAFNYDETATSDSGKTGAVTSCTCMLNGVVVDTVATSTKQNNVNYFRMARYANCNFEIDDVTVSTGTGSLINVPRTSPVSDFVYRETFSNGYANDVNAASAIAEVGGLWLCNQNGSRYDATGGTLKYTDLYNKDYIDLRFNYDAGNNPAGLSYPSTRKDLKRDFTLSMWIKPDTDTFASTFNWSGQGYKVNNSTKWESLFKISEGYFYVNGVKKDSAKLAANEWALVEIVFHYDATATAVTGETGATTSYTFRLNGNDVATADATVLFNNIDNFRMFGNNGGNEFELDDLTVSLGAVSLISLPRSATPVYTSELLFKEDFANGANTNSSAASVIAANGFFADVSNGSTFTTENGYFEYIDKHGGGGDLTDKVNEPARNNDGVYLQLWHDELGMNLSRDFVFSFKVKTQDLNSMRLYWKDHSTSTYEDTTRIEDNRFYTKHDNAKSGAAIPNIVIPSHEWALIEIVFHYDEERTATNGQKGAFAFYSIYLNGKLVRTVSTNYDFHTINDFKLFTYYSDEFAVDDFTITAANRSLASGTDARGWDDKEYFIDKEPVTDYDYSFAVVGDPQCLSGWNPDPLYKMYQWIADNAEAKKLQLVMGVGDIVHYDDGRVGTKDNLTEWERSLAAISKLNGKVTYTLARGNHDKIATYNSFIFNMLGSAYTDQFTEANGGGFYASDKAETFYKKLEVGNDKWLIVGLDFGPTDDELAWIGSVIEANPDYKVIITTHAYLSSNGELLDINEAGCATSDSNAGVGANNADGIWEKLGKKYANISMIISGHIGADYVVKSTQVGENGNTVTQLLVDFQQLDDMKFNGTSGVGMVTMLYFKEGEVTVEVEAYSTTQESYFLEENQYKFNLDGTPVDGEEGKDEDEEEKPQLPTVIFKEDFSGSSVNTSGSAANIEKAGGFFAAVGSGTISLDNNTLNYTTIAGDPYFDLRFNGTTTIKDLTQNFVLSFWIKPESDSLNLQFHWKDTQDGNAYEANLFRIYGGYVYSNGITTKYENAKLKANEWALFELVFNYDEKAISDNGKTGAVTSVTCLLNGVAVDTVETTTKQNNPNYFRMARYANSSFQLDDITVATGSKSLITTLSAYPSAKDYVVPEEPTPDDVITEILYHEDFEDEVNTSGSESGCVSNNGFFNCVAKGSQYVIEDGVIKYTTRISSDYNDIRFYYDATRKDLARDFILSFKIKPDRATLTMDLSWIDKDHSTWETVELSSGRFVANGVTYTEASIPANVWSLVEIAFHFDKNATAVTGEKGAITSYTLMLNGKAIATADAKIDFNNIDAFRLFRYCNSEYEMDDLIVATGNKSLDDGSFADWTPREYYYTDKEPVTDYDYSFAIVGDTQKVTKHYPSKLTKIYDWLLANKDSKNIQFVFGLGDITDTDSAAEWQVAQNAIFKLNGQIPYSLVRGNHDGSEGINTWFYVDEYTSQFEGFFGEGSMENSWRLLDAGSDKYLLITLDFGPTDAELEWAGRIIEAYPDRKVIITTHTYLEPNGKPVDQYYSHAPSVYDETSNDGDDIWNKLGKKYANVFLILSGHISSDYIITTQSVGDNGNVVTQMLIDPQTVDTAFGPSGMVTMLYFKNGVPTVQVETLSTIEEKYFIKENQFSIELEDWSTEEPATDLYFASTFLNLTADINVYYRAFVATGYENPYVVFALGGKLYTVTEYYIDQNGLYCFAFKDVAPQYMGDTITATLYATKDGKTVSVTDSSYSIKAYCIYLLNNYRDAETTALVSDLLVYGAKAQLYANYKTDALVTDGLELSASSFTELDETKNLFALSGNESDKVGWSAAGLYLKNDMALRLIFTAQSLEGLTVEITVNGKTTVYGASDIVADSQGRYVVYFDGMMADELDTAVTAVLKLNGEQVGQTLTYSVATYIYHMQNSDDTALAELVKAIYNYGCSAKKYTGK